MRCWRCGVTRPPEDVEIVLEGVSVRWSDAGGKTGGWATLASKAPEIEPAGLSAYAGYDEMPGEWIGSWTLGSFMSKNVLEMANEMWPGLTWDDLVSAGLRAGEGELKTLWLPYWTPQGWGYQIRRYNREPKVITKGPPGPGFLGPVDLSRPRMWAIVEGWADAAAIPQPYTPLILMGASNWEDAFRVKGDLVFCLDDDDAGRSALKKALLKGIRDRRHVFIVDMALTDPAEEGKKAMAEKLADRVQVRRVGEVV